MTRAFIVDRRDVNVWGRAPLVQVKPVNVTIFRRTPRGVITKAWLKAGWSRRAMSK